MDSLTMFGLGALFWVVFFWWLVRVVRDEKCPECGGSGTNNHGAGRLCGTCIGTGNGKAFTKIIGTGGRWWYQDHRAQKLICGPCTDSGYVHDHIDGHKLIRCPQCSQPGGRVPAGVGRAP